MIWWWKKKFKKKNNLKTTATTKYYYNIIVNAKRTTSNVKNAPQKLTASCWYLRIKILDGFSFNFIFLIYSQLKPNTTLKGNSNNIIIVFRSFTIAFHCCILKSKTFLINLIHWTVEEKKRKKRIRIKFSYRTQR